MFERLTRRRPLVAVALCYLIGAAAGSVSGVPALWWGAGLVLAGVLVFWKRGAALFAALMLLGALSAAAMAQRPMPAGAESVALAGTLCQQPRVDGERTVLTLDGVTVEGRPLGWDARVYAYEPIDARPGDRVSMTADIWAPKGRTNPYGFDFEAWCRMKGVACATMRGDFARIPPDAPTFRTALNAARARAGLAIDQAFPPDQALIVRALLLGDRSALPEEVSEDFRRAGVAHILSISGLHVTCLAFALDFFLRRVLSRRATFCLMAALLCAYTALVGPASPIFRAVVMYLMLRFAPIVGRPSDALTGLAAALLLLLAINPLQVGDAGFILSFCAMAGLILMASPLERLLRTSRWPRFARFLPRSLAASVAASVAILPALANIFGSIQPYAVVVNLLAVPLATAALPLSAVSMAASLIAPAAGRALAWLPSLMIQWLADITGFAARLPGSLLVLGRIPWWLCLAWAAAVYLISDHERVSRRLKPALAAFFPAAVALSMLLGALSMPEGVVLDFLDAGSADAAVVYAEGRVYAVDVGTKSGPSADYLAATGRRLRAVFLTHPHDDHIGGAGELRSLYPGATFYVPECWSRIPGADKAEARAGLAGPYVPLAAGDEVRLSENVSARVLHPPRGYAPSDANDASLVLLLTYGGASALLTGDLEDVFSLYDIPDVDLMKAPHHGAFIKGAEFLLRAASPGALVVSVGSNSLGRPSAALIDRAQRLGARVFRTDRSGMIRAKILADGQIEVSTFLSPKEEP